MINYFLGFLSSAKSQRKVPRGAGCAVPPVPGIAAPAEIQRANKKWRFWFIGSSEMEGERFLLRFGVKTLYRNRRHPNFSRPHPLPRPQNLRAAIDAGEPSSGLQRVSNPPKNRIYNKELA